MHFIATDLSQLPRSSISTNTAAAPPTLSSQLPFTSPIFKFEHASAFNEKCQPLLSDITSPGLTTSTHDLFRSASLNTNQLVDPVNGGGGGYSQPGTSVDQFLVGMGEGTEDLGTDADPILQSLQNLAEGTQFDETLSNTPQNLSLWDWFEQEQ